MARTKSTSRPRAVQDQINFDGGHVLNSAKVYKRQRLENQHILQGSLQQASVLAGEEEEDELGVRQVPALKPARVRKITKKITPKKILETIKAAAAHLAGIGTLEDVEIWLEENDFSEKGCIEDIRKHCKLVSDLLMVKNSDSKENSMNLSGTLANLGHFYIYRKGTKAVELLAPVEVFDAATNNLSPKKGFGFVRRKGSYFPQMYAISGWCESLQAADKLLDGVFWTNELMNFGRHCEFRFKPDGWDSTHNKAEGTDTASHAENQLMLAWSYRLLTKATGSAPSYKKLHHLRRMDMPKDAEIALNDKPCLGCRLFQKELELITGINFTFIELPSLGNMVPVKNHRGYKTWRTQIPLELEGDRPSVEVEEEEEEEYAYISRQAHLLDRHVEQKPKRFEIILPSRPGSLQHAANSEAEFEEEIEVRTRVKVSKSHRQIDFDQNYHTPPKSQEISKKRMRTYGTSSDEDEYDPLSSRSTIRNEDKDFMTPKKKVLTRNGRLTPPGSAEFGRDALEFVKKINKKRMR